jgi:hypothetical protein
MLLYYIKQLTENTGPFQYTLVHNVQEVYF